MTLMRNRKATPRLCIPLAPVILAGLFSFASCALAEVRPAGSRAGGEIQVFVPARVAGLADNLFFLQGASNACDLNADGVVSSADRDLAINMTLGLSPCAANILGAGVCNVIVVQRVINAAMGGACVTGSTRRVSLSWTASVSSNVSGYNVFRGVASGGPYTKVNSALAAGTNYEDSTVQGGQTYYYVVTAVDASNNSSVYSNEANAAVPSP